MQNWRIDCWLGLMQHHRKENYRPWQNVLKFYLRWIFYNMWPERILLLPNTLTGDHLNMSTLYWVWGSPIVYHMGLNWLIWHNLSYFPLWTEVFKSKLHQNKWWLENKQKSPPDLQELVQNANKFAIPFCPFWWKNGREIV